MNAFSLEGKVAIITGAASGIGLSTAHNFLQAGISGLTLTDLSLTTLQKAYATLSPEHQAKIIFVQGDVSSEDDTLEYVTRTINRFGRLDISVQNAGIMQNRAKVWEMDMADYDRVMRVNVKGPFLGVKYSIKAMLESPSQGKDCAIVVLSSQLGLDGGPGLAVYSASKFAMRGLVLSTAEDLGSCGIRINAIAPGPIDTVMLDHIPDDLVPNLIAKCTLGRLGRVEEIANGILYLVSNASRYTTGTTLKVDGGYSKWA